MTARPAPSRAYADDFARGFMAGAMMMREQASRIADEEALFAMAAEQSNEAQPAGVPMHIGLRDYWRMRAGNARVLAEEIYSLPILGELP